jgi:hypothetical protein
LIPISQVFFFSVSKRKGVKKKGREIKSVFGSVVASAFQITFRAKMHANDVFSFFKKLFLTSAHQNDPKYTNHIQF